MNGTKKALIAVSAALMVLSVCCFAAAVVLGMESPVDMTAAAEGAAKAPEEAAVEAILPPPPPPPKPEPYQAADGCWYIELEGVQVLLVNKVYGLPSDFGGQNDVSDAALYAMFDAAEADGISLYLVSGYRSYQYQYDLHESYTQRWGDEYTDRVSAEAGHSEHQTGMAYDVLSTDHSGGLSSDFKDTAGGIWLKEHCWEHGFILRYPEGKEAETGYIFEPWHFRYLGDTALAKAITDSGLCLEEYAELIP